MEHPSTDYPLDALFHQNPLPMWIYDTQTLAFLEVNEAAVNTYGYTRAEFLSMTIAQIRPHEDIDRLHTFTNTARSNWVDAGVWRHITKHGDLLYVKIVSHQYTYLGQAARFVLAVDVTAQKHTETEISRVLERAKRYTVQLQRANRLAQRLTIGVTPEQLLQEITDEVRQIIGAHLAATRFTVNGNWSQSINAISLSSKYSNYQNYSTLPNGSGIYSLVCRTNQPMRLTQAQLEAHPAWQNFGLEAHNHPPMNGWLAAPLVDRRGNNIGLIQLSDKTEGEFADDDEAILSQLAHMASSMLDNTRLYAALQATEARMSTLYSLGRQLAVLNDRQSVMQTVIDQARELVSAPWAMFVFIRTQAEDVTSDEYVMSGFTGDIRPTLLGIGRQGQLGDRVFQQQHTVCIQDLSQLDPLDNPRLTEIAARYNLDVRSFLGVPVISDSGKSLGGLFFGSPHVAAFKPRHQQLAEAIAANAGVTLEKLILQDEIKRHASNLEARVAERTAQLERANSELEAFTYSVSHDLRAPLRAIDGFSQILLDKYGHTLDQMGGHYLTRIRAGTQRMGQLIDDLLELSRVNRKELARKQVNLTRMAHAVVAELRQSEPDRETEMEIADNLIAQGDEQLLHIVLHNLLGNAWKFTGKNAQAVIRFYQEQLPDGRCAFRVSDNGAGFSMAYIDKLFGVFQRLHRADEFPGTGVGLATVQRIIHRHGGKIWAEGALNEGATFWFTLQAEDPS